MVSGAVQNGLDGEAKRPQRREHVKANKNDDEVLPLAFKDRTHQNSRRLLVSLALAAVTGGGADFKQRGTDWKCESRSLLKMIPFGGKQSSCEWEIPDCHEAFPKKMTQAV